MSASKDSMATSASPRSDGRFSIAQRQSLEEGDWFLPGLVAGTKRKISSGLYSPPSSSTSSSNSTTPSASLNFKNSPAPNFTMELPTCDDDADALVFIGLTKDTATQISGRFAARPDPEQNHYGIFDYIKAHVRQFDPDETLDDRQSMTMMGIASWLQDALLMPKFRHLFMPNTLHYWVEEALETGYLNLQLLHSRCENAAATAMMTKSKTSNRGRIPSSFTSASASGSSQPPPAASASGSSQPPPAYIATVTPTENSTDAFNCPEKWVKVGNKQPLRPDHVVLYKGISVCRLQDWIHEDDGEIDVTKLASSPGGDFNRANLVWYWTEQRQTAEQYREWAALITPYADTALMEIQVDEGFLQSLGIEELWYSAAWKEFVWCNKKKMSPPAKFARQMSANILKGHIAVGNETKYTRVKKEQVQQKIDADWLMIVPGTSARATQHAVMNLDTASKLAVHIKGKIHLDITTALQAVEGGSKLPFSVEGL